MNYACTLWSAIVCTLIFAGCAARGPAGDHDVDSNAATSSSSGVARAEPKTPREVWVAEGDLDDLAIPLEDCEKTESGAVYFFDAFVTSRKVREAYTDPRALAAGIDPARFKITAIDQRWSYVDLSLDPKDYPRLELDLNVSGNKFHVSYTGARYEGDDETVETFAPKGRYDFEFIDGCWRLLGEQPIG